MSVCSLTKLVNGAVISHSTIAHPMALLKQGYNCCKSGVCLRNFWQKGWTLLLCNSYHSRAQHFSWQFLCDRHVINFVIIFTFTSLCTWLLTNVPQWYISLPHDFNCTKSCCSWGAINLTSTSSTIIGNCSTRVNAPVRIDDARVPCRIVKYVVTEHNVPGLNSLTLRKGTKPLEIFMLQCFHFVFSYVPFHTYLWGNDTDNLIHGMTWSSRMCRTVASGNDPL